jgi:hypothetical protein
VLAAATFSLANLNGIAPPQVQTFSIEIVNICGMSFNERGFLEPPDPMQVFASRAKFKPYYQLVEDLNGVAMRQIWDIKIEGSRRDLIYGATQFVRCVRLNQAAVSLLDAGMSVEAQVLCRTMVECVIHMAKLALHPMHAEALENEFDRHQITQAKKILEHAEAPDSDLVAYLQDIASQPSPDVPFKLEQLASEVKLQMLYHVIYRETSGYAAHGTLGGAIQHITASDDGPVIDFGRQYDKVGATLAMLIPLALEAIEQFEKLFPDLELGDTLKMFNLRWQHLCEKRPLAEWRV